VGGILFYTESNGWSSFALPGQFQNILLDDVAWYPPNNLIVIGWFPAVNSNPNIIMNNIANCDITTGQCYPMGQGLVDSVPQGISEIWTIGSSIFVAYFSLDLTGIVLATWDEGPKEWVSILTSEATSVITTFNGSLVAYAPLVNGTACTNGTAEGENFVRYNM
jgi:hypothetical protein